MDEPRNLPDPESIDLHDLEAVGRSVLSLVGSLDFRAQIHPMILSTRKTILALNQQNMAKVSQALTKSMEILQIAKASSDVLASRSSELFSSMDQVTRLITANWAAFHSSVKILLDSELFKRLQERLELDEKTVRAFKAAGWPIAPSMDGQLRSRVVELFEQGKASYATQTILGHYRRGGSANLIAAVESWNDHPLFSPRMHIIKDSLFAHLEGFYTLSVPALIPQVEGILTEYAALHRTQVSYGKISQVYRAAIGDPNEHTFDVWPIASSLLYLLENSIYIFTDFEAELQKAVPARTATRHTILHGVNIGYDRQMHSLRVFILLDAIYALEISEV